MNQTGPSAKKNHLVHGDASQHATRIAEAVSSTWHQANHSGRRDVALSVVAGLSLLGQRDPHGPNLADELMAQDAAEFVEVLKEIYTALINQRPDLMHAVFPMMRWLFDVPAPTLGQAAKRVADTALTTGQLDLTGTARRFHVDLLGLVLSQLKSQTATGANAQIYTPSGVADLMARLDPPREADTVHEPAVGTGGLLRSCAVAMRELDRDPATVSWYGADIDELAIAACAINSLLWGLGPHVLLCVADTLTEGDWPARADAQRAELVNLSTTIRRDKMLIKAIRSAQHLTDIAAPDRPTHGDDP